MVKGEGERYCTRSAGSSEHTSAGEMRRGISKMDPPSTVGHKNGTTAKGYLTYKKTGLSFESPVGMSIESPSDRTGSVRSLGYFFSASVFSSAAGSE